MVQQQKKLIILDRDGVINHDSDEYIKSPAEWIPIEGSLEAIARLNKAGYVVAIASNQSGIARGFYSENTLQKMHDKMHGLLAKVGANVDTIVYCPHGPDDGCKCRKPQPGMLLKIVDKYQANLSKITFVGDTLSDAKAAKNAGVSFALVKTGKGEKTLRQLQEKAEIADTMLVSEDQIHDSVADFVNSFLDG